MSRVPEVSDVRGVALCDSMIFVVFRQSDTMHVFRPECYTNCSIHVKGLKAPRDLVASAETKHLFIADSTCQTVWRVNLEGRAEKWVSTSPVMPQSISLRSGRLLVTTWRSGLFLYGPDGNGLNRVWSRGMKEVYHAVKTSHETFVVCYFKHLDSQPHVSEFDVDSNVIRDFSDQKSFVLPCYLAVGSNDQIFVADIRKRRVMLMNDSLELERIALDVLDEHQRTLYPPSRICFVQDTGQIVVGSADCIELFALDELKVKDVQDTKL